MRKILILWVLAILGGGSLFAESKALLKFNELSKEEQTALAEKKSSREGRYYTCKVGRYNIFSDNSAYDAYWWGLTLDSYTKEALDEGIVPKKPVVKGLLKVYILKDKEGYDRALSEYTGGMISDGGWSVGMFIPIGKKAALMGYNYRDKKELVSTMLHECTHQLVRYHIGNEVPVWFNEGIATNMETYDTQMSMKANLYNAMYINNRAIGAVNLLGESQLVAFPILFNMSLRQWNTSSGKTVNANYSSAWAACNFIFTTKKGRKFVGRFINATRKGGFDAAKSSISSKNQDKIDGMVREHIKEVLLPCVKYGRDIRKSLNSGNFKKAKELLEKMAKEFPESNEMKFYKAWIDIEENKDPKKAVKEVYALKRKTDFFHPDFYYVTTLGYVMSGDNAKAGRELKDALKTNPKHPGVIMLQHKLKN